MNEMGKLGDLITPVINIFQAFTFSISHQWLQGYVIRNQHLFIAEAYGVLPPAYQVQALVHIMIHSCDESCFTDEKTKVRRG